MRIKSRWMIGLAALGATWIAVDGCKCNYTKSWTETSDTLASTSPPAGTRSMVTNTRSFSFPSLDSPPIRRVETEASEQALLGDPVGPVSGDRIRLEPKAAHPLLLAGRSQKTYLKIGLTGFNLDADDRPPANVAIVLDRSGSMAGEKLHRAKEAAVMVVRSLRPDDVISVVAYDDRVEVLVPATRASETQPIIDGIQRYQPGGSTALYDGVIAGAEEVRRHLDRERTNRVVLLSDGQANVGPRSAQELGQLGERLGGEGIGVTTIGLGLGYNTDLMTGLATRSEGNHFFARTAQDLAEGFGLEFGVGLAVVARDAHIQIRLADGFRPLRVLNSKASIEGNTVTADIPLLYANHQAYLLLEVEALPEWTNKLKPMAEVALSYHNTKTGRTDRLSAGVSVAYTDSVDHKQSKEQAEVMEAVAVIEAAHQSLEAIRLREQGRIADARQEFERSAALLRERSRRYGSSALRNLARQHQSSSERVEDDKKFKSDVNLHKHKSMKDFGARNRPY